MMRKFEILILLCFFSLPLLGQTKTVTITKGTVYWERTIPKSEYKKLLKSGEIDKVKNKISNIAYQNAVMQESSVASIINSISAFDETNPESAIDAVYSEFQSYSQIEWIEGPFNVFTERETSIFGIKSVVLTAIVYGKFIRYVKSSLPDNDHFVSLIKNNKTVVVNPSHNNSPKQNYYNLSIGYTSLYGAKLWFTKNRFGLGLDIGLRGDGYYTDNALYSDKYFKEFGSIGQLSDLYILGSLPCNLISRTMKIYSWYNPYDFIFQMYPIGGFYFPQQYEQISSVSGYSTTIITFYDNYLFSYGAGMSFTGSFMSLHWDMMFLKFEDRLNIHTKIGLGITIAFRDKNAKNLPSF